MPAAPPELPYLSASRGPGVPLAFAHRGFSPEDALWENSLRAFQAVADLGFEHLEADVWATSDGTAVVFHDATVTRTTGSAGKISDLSSEELSRLRIGGSERIPTLAELVSALPEAKFNLDVKCREAIAPMAELIEELGLHDRVCVASFSDRRRRAVLRRLSRPAVSSAGVSAMACFVLLGPWWPRRWMKRLLRDVDCLQVPPSAGWLRLVTRRTLKRAHGLGLQVHVWTINEPLRMQEFLDLGVDGVMTDRADLLAEVMRERGYWR